MLGDLDTKKYGKLLQNSINDKEKNKKHQNLATIPLISNLTSLKKILSDNSSQKINSPSVKKSIDIKDVNQILNKVNRVEDNAEMINFLTETQDADEAEHIKMNKIDFYMKLKGIARKLYVLIIRKS